MRTSSVAVAVLAAGALVLAAGSYRQTRSVELTQDFSRINQVLAHKVAQDEKSLQSDVMKQQQMLKMEGATTQNLEMREYPDGCKCECAASGCDAEKGEGPVCSCPKEAQTSLPPPMAPWPFQMPGAARGGRSQSIQRQALYSNMQHMHPAQVQQHVRPVGQQAARFQQKWVGSPQKFLPPDGDYPGGSTGVPMDGYLAYETGYANDGPFHGELAPMQEAGIADNAQPQALRGTYAYEMQQAHARNSRAAVVPRNMAQQPQRAAQAHAGQQQRAHFQTHARTQKKWVGSPQKFLPPDGDYPGGSTGVPMDGYLAYETGWANDGPFHGELAPIQEAGIADKAQRPQSLRALPQLVAARANKKMYGAPRTRKQRVQNKATVRKSLLGDEMFGGDFDERVPARAVDSNLFARSHTKSATLDAMDSLIR